MLMAQLKIMIKLPIEWGMEIFKEKYLKKNMKN